MEKGLNIIFFVYLLLENEIDNFLKSSPANFLSYFFKHYCVSIPDEVPYRSSYLLLDFW